MTTEIPGELPPEIANLLRKVEAACGSGVYWQEDVELGGAMSAVWAAGEPVIWYRSYSHAGAAEELHHLLLDLEGYLRLKQRGNCRITFHAMMILHNALQHAVIFPRLATMGYSRDVGECNAVARQLEKHQAGNFDTGRIRKEPKLRALLAMLYVRAALHCSPKDVERLTGELYRQPDYAAPRQLGTRVLSKIDIDESSSAEQYNAVAAKCLDVLGFSHSVVLVDGRTADDD